MFTIPDPGNVGYEAPKVGSHRESNFPSLHPETMSLDCWRPDRCAKLWLWQLQPAEPEPVRLQQWSETQVHPRK